MMNNVLSRFGCVIVALLGLAPARAAGSMPYGTISVSYDGYSHGLMVVRLEGTLTLTPAGYGAHVTFHTVGMAAWILPSDNDSEATGRFNGDLAVPQLFTGTGHLRGISRTTRLVYHDGNPVVEKLSPPVETERSSVDPSLTGGTVDTLSAAVMLIHAVARTHTCDGTVRTFDGRRLASQTAKTGGVEVLPATDRSIFTGPTLRCDFVGEQLAGFVHTEDEDSLRKPRPGTAWLADLVPGAPPVPVRVMFENKSLGQVTLYLTAARGAPLGNGALPIK